MRMGHAVAAALLFVVACCACCCKAISACINVNDIRHYCVARLITRVDHI